MREWFTLTKLYKNKRILVNMIKRVCRLAAFCDLVFLDRSNFLEEGLFFS